MQRLGAGTITENADVETLAFDWGVVRMLSEPQVTGAQRHSFGIVEVLQVCHAEWSVTQGPSVSGTSSTSPATLQPTF